MQDQTNQKFTLTIEKVKERIAFQPGSSLHSNLCGLCDCRFKIEKLKGATDEEAARSTLDMLVAQMDKLLAKVNSK